jgi:hypothetical protein
MWGAKMGRVSFSAVLIGFVALGLTDQKVGAQRIENFETGDFLRYPWEPWYAGGARWQVGSWSPHSGVYAAECYAAFSSGFSSSGLGVYLYCGTAANISFWTSFAASPVQDFCFYIDDQVIARWTNSSGWKAYSFPVAVGWHSFEWEYNLPFGTTAGDIYALLDDITFPPDDTVSPTATTIVPAPLSTINSSSANIDVTFSEPVTGVDASDMALSGSAAGAASVSTPTDLGGNTWRFPIVGLTNGTLQINLAPDPNDIEDQKGNDLSPRPTTWSYAVVDLTPPAVTAQVPAAGAMLSTPPTNIDVTFSERVVGVDASDMVLSGAAAAGASVGTPTNQGGNKWRFPIIGLTNGTLQIDLAADPDDIEDPAGNDLSPRPTTWSCTVDLTPPIVTAQVPVPTSTLAAGATNIDVTFSEPVTGVDATDMKLSGTAAAGATVGTPTDQGGSTWRFPIAALTNGALQIDLAPDLNDIRDLAGNNLSPRPTTWSYTVVDLTAPTVTAWLPATNSTLVTSSTNIDVTFSEVVVGVDASDMVLSGAAAGGAGVGTPTNQGGNKWRFPITGLTSGTLQVDLAPDPNDIEDPSGNDLSPRPTTWSYTVDVTPPTVTAQVPAPGSTLVVGSTNIDVTFSETVTGVDASDMVLSGSAAAGASVSTPTDRGGNTWRFPVSGMSTGVLQIALAPDLNDIRDLAGNNLSPRPTAWSYTVVDLTPPTVTARVPAPGAMLNTSSTNVDVTFSEPVVGVDASDMVLSGAAAGGAGVGTPTDQGGNKWRFPITGLTNGTLQIDLAPDPNDIEDPSGNDLSPRPTTWSYTVDLTPPTVTAQVPVPGANLLGGAIYIDVTFSEAVTGVDGSDMVLSGTAAAGATVGTPTDQGGNTWRFPVSGVGMGVLEITLAPDLNDILDLAGNNLSPRPTTWAYTVQMLVIGKKLWDKRFGGTSHDYCMSVQETHDGGFILGGYSYSDAGGDKTEDCRGNADYWVVRINSAGTKLWDKRFGGTDWDYCMSLQETRDGGFILGGYSFSGAGGDKTEGSRGSCDDWAVRVDSAGNRLWDKRFGGTDLDFSMSLQETRDGGFILGGTSFSGAGADKTEASRGSPDYWVVRVDSAGTKLWDRRFGGTGEDRCTSLQETRDSGFILGGYSLSGAGGDKTEASRGAYDYWIVRLAPDDSDGDGMTDVWEYQYFGNSTNAVASEDSDGDGLNNWQEWLAGTNPTNAASVLRLQLPVLLPGSVALTWTSVTNRTYFVQRATNLLAPSAFSLLQTNILGLLGTTSFTDTSPPVSGPAYYRVGVQP